MNYLFSLKSVFEKIYLKSKKLYFIIFSQISSAEMAGDHYHQRSAVHVVYFRVKKMRPRCFWCGTVFPYFFLFNQKSVCSPRAGYLLLFAPLLLCSLGTFQKGERRVCAVDKRFARKRRERMREREGRVHVSLSGAISKRWWSHKNANAGKTLARARMEKQ